MVDQGEEIVEHVEDLQLTKSLLGKIATFPHWILGRNRLAWCSRISCLGGMHGFLAV